MKISPLLLAAACLLAGAGCASTGSRAPKGTAATQPAAPPSFWNPGKAHGRGKIRIVLSAQRAYFCKGGTVIGESTISSGKKGYETPPGEYRVIQKDKDHVSTLYGDYIDDEGEVIEKNIDTSRDHRPKGAKFDGAVMPYFLRFTGGYGMHAGFLPGYAASHGCVRMPKEMARHFFEAAKIGTHVEVEP